MAEFKIALQRTLVHEGSYSNDPDDQGGETYKGISRSRHGEWAGWVMIDRYKLKSGFPSSLNIDSRLQAEVEQFYRISFWDPLHGEQIRDQSVADSIFDFGVNAGVKTSVRLAQWVAGTVADGVIGEKTLDANAGLVVAEIELPEEDTPFTKPDWIGAEVSHDARYFNSNLIKHPYSEW